MKFRAVLFDLDGTLLNTLDDLANSVNSVLTRRGYSPHVADRYRYFVGDGIHNLVARALPLAEAENHELVAACVADVDREYSQRWHERTKPYPGTEELIETLHQKDLQLAILSNKPHTFTVQVVDWFFPKKPFITVYGARDTVPRKPDPSAAKDIARELDIPPEYFLYLGDTNTDMQTALNAGMFPVGAAWGFRTVEELKESGAREIIRHPHELLKHIE